MPLFLGMTSKAARDFKFDMKNLGQTQSTRISDSDFRFLISDLRLNLGFRISDLGFQIFDFEFKICDSRFEIADFFELRIFFSRK